MNEFTHRLLVRTRMLLVLMLLAIVPAFAQGLTWEPLGPSGAFRYEPIGADSSGAIYAARYRSSGIQRSLDRGTTWSEITPSAMTGFAASRTAIYIVDAGGRLLRSTDRGGTWTVLAPYSSTGSTEIASIVASPDGALYATTRLFFPNPAEILLSTDEGATWFTLSTPGERGVRIIGLALDGSLFITADATSYRSSDRGDNWAPIPGLPGSIGDVRFDASGRLYTQSSRRVHSSTDHGATWTQGGAVPEGFGALMAVASDGAIVVAASYTNEKIPFASTTDRGTTWHFPIETSSTLVPASLIASGEDFFASCADQIGSDMGTGILRSTDHGVSFESVGRGLSGPSITALHAVGDSVIVAVTDGYLYYRMRRTDLSWQWIGRGSQKVERGPDGALYAVANNGYVRSTDAGLTWQNSDTTQKVYPTRGCPGPRGQYIASVFSKAIMRTSDFGRTWVRLDSSFAEEATAMAFDSTGAILVGTLQAGLYRYDSQADRFRALNARVSGSTVTDIVVTQEGVIVVATDGGGIRRSSDGGATFKDAHIGLRSLVVYALAVNSRGDLLAGTDSSLYLSRNDGASWGFEGVGLPTTVAAISVDPVDRVVVGTPVGVFISRESTSSAPRVIAADESIGLRCIPNPASSRVHVIFDAPGGHAFVHVVDALGRVVATLHDGALPSGPARLEWNAGAAPDGAYRVVVGSGGALSSSPLVLVR